MKPNSSLHEFTKYTCLNVLGMLGLSCYILADTFFVATGLGSDGLAALNLAIPFYSFIHGSGLMCGIGGATRYAMVKSQNQAKTGNQIFTHTLLFALAISLILVCTGLFFSHTIIQAMGATGSVYQMSRTYLYVVLLFSPVFMLNNVLLCFVRNDGAPQLSMAAMLTGSFSNVLLDYIFIFPLQMGIFGAVFATGLAPLISMMVLSPYFLKKKHAFHLIPCSFSLSHLKMIFFSGLPSLVTEASSGIVIIVFNAIILGIQGNIGIAAYGVVANLSLVVLSIYTGIAQGIQPIISSHYGAGNYSKIQAIFRYAMITLFLLSGLIYGGIFLWAPEIASIFNSEQLVTLSQIAVGGLRIYFTACLFVGFNIILSVYFTSTDRPFPAHILSLLRGFFIIIPLAFLFSRLAGMTGVWLTFPVTELTVAIVGFLFYRRASLPPS